MLFDFSLAPLVENISVESGLILILRNEFLVRSWVSEQPGLVEDVPAHCRGVGLDDL